MGVKGNQTKARNIAYRDKQVTALEMRRQGYLLREIADALGIESHSTVSKLIKKALKEIVREPAEHVLQMELDRLDAMFVQAYARASDREKPFNKDAVETCLKVMERRAKLLGIDKPAKVANTDPSGEREVASVQVYLPANSRD
jgi:transcriptional regulator